MDIPPPVHCTISHPHFHQELIPTAAKILAIHPQVLLGETRLFLYDPTTQTLNLTPALSDLLEILVELQQLDPGALQASTLAELDRVLQKTQGTKGGLLRKEGTERWDLKDNAVLLENAEKIKGLFCAMGLWSETPKRIEGEIAVDHCIIFGATVTRMERRVQRTLEYLSKNVGVTGHVFLLGSIRKLTEAELLELRTKIGGMNLEQQRYWTEVFADPREATEANAFLMLWNNNVSTELREKLAGKVIAIKSTRNGVLSSGQEYHRPTTVETVDDWMPYFEKGTTEHQKIFALVEEPYTRLADRLRTSVLTKGGKTSEGELLARIDNTTFFFAVPTPAPTTLLSVVLDEVARNVHEATKTLHYFQTLD